MDDWWTAQVSADGREVTLPYVGGECGDATSQVRVDENSERVELTIVTTAKITRQACSDLGVSLMIIARLSEPLGDRQLVDGHCAHPEWGETYACAGH